jgi:site-specific recombinase XerD
MFKAAVLSPLTVLAYERDMRVFRAWCEAAGRMAVPATAETVELYASDMLTRGRKVSTLERHSGAINRAHKMLGLEKPCGPELRKLLSGARRTLCQPSGRKEAIRVEDLKRMVQVIGYSTPIGARNCAILLFGFASSLRRSNLAAMQMADLEFCRRGIRVQVRREKQDREGRGRELAVPNGKRSVTCPVKAVERWIDYRGKTAGPLFTRCLNGQADLVAIKGNRICQVVQEAAEAIGLDRKRFGAHSLRSGFVTEGLQNGASEVMIAQQTGHASMDTLRGYYRSRDLFRGNACSRLGL